MKKYTTLLCLLLALVMVMTCFTGCAKQPAQSDPADTTEPAQTTDTTPENLYEEESDKILHDLKDLFHYTGMDGCRMRCGYHFDYDGMELTYHKTLPYSTILEEDENGQTYRILYDIIVKQTGQIHSDWDGTVMDVDAYRNVVFEPYDLVVREGYINE